MFLRCKKTYSTKSMWKLESTNKIVDFRAKYPVSVQTV